MGLPFKSRPSMNNKIRIKLAKGKNHLLVIKRVRKGKRDRERQRETERN